MYANYAVNWLQLGMLNEPQKTAERYYRNAPKAMGRLPISNSAPDAGKPWAFLEDACALTA